jgi:hypothetical protein
MVPQWVILWGVLNGVEGLTGITAATPMEDLDVGRISVLAMIWHVVLALLWTPVFLHGGILANGVSDSFSIKGVSGC